MTKLLFKWHLKVTNTSSLWLLSPFYNSRSMTLWRSSLYVQKSLFNQGRLKVKYITAAVKVTCQVLSLLKGMWMSSLLQSNIIVFFKGQVSRKFQCVTSQVTVDCEDHVIVQRTFEGYEHQLHVCFRMRCWSVHSTLDGSAYVAVVSAYGLRTSCTVVQISTATTDR